MSGGLLTSMRNDAANLVTAGGFETDIVVTDKNSKTATVQGLITANNSKFDVNTGLTVNARQAHCLLATAALVAAGLDVYCDAKDPDKAALKGWKVSFPDAHGKTRDYVVSDARPSETIGLISCFLGDR